MYPFNKSISIKNGIIGFIVSTGGIISFLSSYFHHETLGYISSGLSGITLCIILVIPDRPDASQIKITPLLKNEKINVNPQDSSKSNKSFFIDENNKEYELIQKMEYLHEIEKQLIEREQKLNLYIATELCRPPSTDMYVSGDTSPSLSTSTSSLNSYRLESDRDTFENIQYK